MSKAQEHFNALQDWEKISIASAVFQTLEYDVDGNPGSEWSADTLQNLGDLFEAYGITFSSPEVD